MNITGPTLGYRPSLDGLRGVAISCVFIRHLEIGLPLGFLGVDIFFVLSGFLITTLLLEEHRATDTISLKQFYLRRAFRLLPALLCFLTVMVVYSQLFLSPEVASETFRIAVCAVFYSTNWIFVFGGLDSGLLNHLWSLAIEEQFYFLWPITLSLLLKSSLPRRAILYSTLIVIAFVGAYRSFLLMTGTQIQRVYFGSDTRADCILLGCAVAMLVTWSMVRLNRRVLRIGGLVSIGVIVIYLVNVFNFSNHHVYSIGLSIFALAVAWLILQTMTAPHRLVMAVLENPVLVWIGKLSYSLYLWHYFSVALAMWLTSSSLTRTLIAVPLALIFASASYYFVERPFLKLKARLGNPPLRLQVSKEIGYLGSAPKRISM